MSLRSTSSADVNRSTILARLGANGPESRAQLARALRISPALMSQLTRQLISDGLLVELEQTPSQGGRPARLLGLNAMAGHAVGVKLDQDHATFVELAIDSTLIRSAIEPLNASAATYLQDLIILLKRFVSGSVGSLLGIGIGVPGSVDEQGNGIVDSAQLKMQQVPLGATLQREMGLPVIIENNVNALTVAERLYGLGRHHESFLVITVGPEVGAGLMMDGILYRGHSGSAGDIGHLPIQEDGPLCSCGNRGCLQALVGQAALVATARNREVIGQRGTITALGAAADAGEAAAQAIFSEAGHILGRAVAILAQTLDPEVVILLGEATASWSHWAFGFEPAFRSGLAAGRRGMPVVVESWQDLSWAQGAASLIFATPFDAEGMAGEQGRLIRERLFVQSTTGSQIR